MLSWRRVLAVVALGCLTFAASASAQTATGTAGIAGTVKDTSGPNSARAHNDLGVTLSKKGDLDGAIAEFREALRLDPNYGPAHFNLGLTLLRDSKTKAGREMIGKHWENVVAEFGEATRLQPNNDVAHYELGWVLEMRGERDRA